MPGEDLRFIPVTGRPLWKIRDLAWRDQENNKALIYLKMSVVAILSLGKETIKYYV